MCLKLYGTIGVPLLELIVRNIARYPQSATSTPIRYQPAIRYLVPCLRVPSSASKMIYEPMVRSTQTVDQSCVKISTICKQTEMRFHMAEDT
jgi:hypothetical protein